MKAKVLRYEAHEGCCMCEMEDGSKHRIDLEVNGDLGGLTQSALVGKTVEFERIWPYVSIASGVRVLDEVVQ